MVIEDPCFPLTELTLYYYISDNFSRYYRTGAIFVTHRLLDLYAGLHLSGEMHAGSVWGKNYGMLKSTLMFLFL